MNLSAIQQIFAIIGGVIILVGVAAVVIVYLRSAIDKGTIEALQRSNAALKEKDTLQEEEIEDLKSRVSRLERENNLLASQRPSAEAIADIDRKLKEHDETMRRGFKMLGEGGS